MRTAEVNPEQPIIQVQGLTKTYRSYKKLPGLKGAISDENLAQGEGQLKKFETIIDSMTAKERRSPKLIDMSRKIRIAKGAGVIAAAAMFRRGSSPAQPTSLPAWGRCCCPSGDGLGASKKSLKKSLPVSWCCSSLHHYMRSNGQFQTQNGK